MFMFFFFFSSRRRHTRSDRDWSSDVCSSDLLIAARSPEAIGALVATLRGTVAGQALNQPAPGQSHSLGELLSLATPSAQTQSALLNAYVQHNGPVQDFWKNLGQDPQFKDP